MKTEEQQFKKAIEDTRKIGEYVGKRCVAPLASVVEGNYRFVPELLFSGVKCYNTGKKIEEIAEAFPEMKEPLGAVFEAAATVGGCRFWKTHKQSVPSECNEASKLLEEAEAKCLAAYAMKK